MGVWRRFDGGVWLVTGYSVAVSEGVLWPDTQRFLPDAVGVMVEHWRPAPFSFELNEQPTPSPG